MVLSYLKKTLLPLEDLFRFFSYLHGFSLYYVFLFFQVSTKELQEQVKAKKHEISIQSAEISTAEKRQDQIKKHLGEWELEIKRLKLDTEKLKASAENSEQMVCFSQTNKLSVRLRLYILRAPLCFLILFRCCNCQTSMIGLRKKNINLETVEVCMIFTKMTQKRLKRDFQN